MKWFNRTARRLLTVTFFAATLSQNIGCSYFLNPTQKETRDYGLSEKDDCSNLLEDGKYRDAAENPKYVLCMDKALERDRPYLEEALRSDAKLRKWFYNK